CSSALSICWGSKSSVPSRLTRKTDLSIALPGTCAQDEKKPQINVARQTYGGPLVRIRDHWEPQVLGERRVGVVNPTFDLGQQIGVLSDVGLPVRDYVLGFQLGYVYNNALDYMTEDPYLWLPSWKAAYGRCQNLRHARAQFERGHTGPLVLSDPLVLDLDGDGVETTAVSGSASFDLGVDGFAEKSGWVSADDGLLVMDRNGDGVINDGRELFGDQTILASGLRSGTGFQALADLDSNRDGKIDANDPAFSLLRVWKDEFEDGSSSEEELYALDGLGIASIDVQSTPSSQTDAQGNTRNRIGSFQWTDGSTGQMADYTFDRDGMYSYATEELEVPEDIGTLPNLFGHGTVYNLQQAMVRDSSGHLKSLVEQIIQEPDPDSRTALMDQILLAWTGSEAVVPGSRGAHFDAQKLSVLEKFFGEPFVAAGGANPIAESVPALNQSYRSLRETIYARLMALTQLSDLYGYIPYTWKEHTHEVRPDVSHVMAKIQNAFARNADQGRRLLGEFARTARGEQLMNTGEYLTFRETFIAQEAELSWVIDSSGLPLIDGPHQGLFPQASHVIGTHNAEAIRPVVQLTPFINGEYGEDVIYGASGDDCIIHIDGDSLIVAGGGNDTVYAGAGNDIVDGGEGQDTLYGEGGNDTYIFRRSSGQDRIIDIDPTAGNVDTIWVGSSLTPDEVRLRRVGDGLVVTTLDTTDTVLGKMAA
ncbi:MAG: hypothetical protein AB1646_26440, partial [Thermodesulfobacteriota bacterium]